LESERARGLGGGRTHRRLQRFPAPRRGPAVACLGAPDDRLRALWLAYHAARSECPEPCRSLEGGSRGPLARTDDLGYATCLPSHRRRPELHAGHLRDGGAGPGACAVRRPRAGFPGVAGSTTPHAGRRCRPGLPALVLAPGRGGVLGLRPTTPPWPWPTSSPPAFAPLRPRADTGPSGESFVEASTSIVRPPPASVLVRILPNVMTGLVVGVAIAPRFGRAGRIRTGLLGPRPPPPPPVGEASPKGLQHVALHHPCPLVPAGLTIALTVLAFNTIGGLAAGHHQPAPRRGSAAARCEAPRGITAWLTRGKPIPAQAARARCFPGGVEWSRQAGAPGGPRPERRVRRPERRAGSGGRRRLLRRRRRKNRRAGGRIRLRQDCRSLAVLRLLQSRRPRSSGFHALQRERSLEHGVRRNCGRIRGREIGHGSRTRWPASDPSFTVGLQLTGPSGCNGEGDGAPLPGTRWRQAFENGTPSARRLSRTRKLVPTGWPPSAGSRR